MCCSLWELPGGEVTALLHEGSQAEPQAVKDAELIGWLISIRLFLCLISFPLIWTEAADEEQHNAHPDVGKHDTHPDLVRQRVEEREDARLGLLRLFDHDGDSEAHEGFREVDHFLPHEGDC